MNSEKKYLFGWLSVQWVVSIPAVLLISYVFFSDVHGLPTAGFFVLSITIIAIETFGYVAALRALRTWREC